MPSQLSLCCRDEAVEDTHQGYFICLKCLRICQLKFFEYDIFLGGVWERYSSVPYKRIIKSVFSDLKIYDPKDYLGENWFARNLQVLENSRSLLVMVPEFPFPLVAVEAGFYYAHHCPDKNSGLSNLVICWPEKVKPDWVKKNLFQLGQVANSLEEAIIALLNVLYRDQAKQLAKEVEIGSADYNRHRLEPVSNFTYSQEIGLLGGIRLEFEETGLREWTISAPGLGKISARDLEKVIMTFLATAIVKYLANEAI